MIHGRRVEGEEREKRAWGVVLPKYLISGQRHGGGNNKRGHMIVTKHDHTTLTVICRRLAIKVTKTLDINVPGILSGPLRPTSSLVYETNYEQY